MIKIIIRGILLFSFAFSLVHSKLVTVHAIFRHGERTADTFLMYPNDPFKNETFYPYGNGQLTNVGKKTMFNLGKMLRKRYGGFLGDVYQPDMLDSWASSLTRTQVALQLVLAGLFPPNDLLVWDENLKWQPIPYRFLPKEQDTLLLSVLLEEYKRLYYEYCKTNEVKRLIETFEPTLSYIRKYSGSPANTPRDFFFLYITLSTEYDYGLTLPQWTETIYPQPLLDLIHVEFELEMGTKELKRYIVGDIMKKILTDTENIIAAQSDCKIHLYSAHDVNIIYALRFLGLMYKHAPGYGACLSIEVHEENGNYFLQVYYKDDKYSNFKLLKFRNGQNGIYLGELRNLVYELFEEDEKVLAERSSRNSVPRIFEEQIIYFHILIIIIYSNFII